MTEEIIPIRLPLTLRKRLLFCSVLLALMATFAETSALVMYRVGHGCWFSWRSMCERRAAIGSPESSSEFVDQVRQMTWHPYTGYVLNPDFRPNPNIPSRPVTEFGYYDEKPPLQRRAAGKCIVAIIGGSVAQNFSFDAEILVENLRRSEQFSAMDITVVNLALAGYKQPQQLMTLAYMLTLGAEFDIVVNIDGFNEVALHEAENGRFGVFPIYPRNWPNQNAGRYDQALQRELRRRDSASERRQALARTFSRWPLRDSAVCNLIWTWRDQVCVAELQGIEEEIRCAVTPRTRFIETGPRVSGFAEGDVYQHLAGIWQRSSLQLNRLCQANGIRYYHFLQPNQYVAGSKILNPYERGQAFDENHRYRPGVEKGYPLLIDKGQDLVRAGVRFVDLTRVFAETEETIYCDTCCHVNQRGDNILAAHVARAIIEDTMADVALRSGVPAR